jgi:hypothetical protein
MTDHGLLELFLRVVLVRMIRSSVVKYARHRR